MEKDIFPRLTLTNNSDTAKNLILLPAGIICRNIRLYSTAPGNRQVTLRF